MAQIWEKYFLVDSLCSREYAVPETKSPYVKPKNFAHTRHGNSRFQCTSETNSVNSAKSVIQSAANLYAAPELPRSCLKFIEKIGEGQFGEVSAAYPL